MVIAMSLRSSVLYSLISCYWNRFGTPLDGRKKLQKLLFLTEHWDPYSNKIAKSSGLTGFVFRIYYYGPFSKEVYDCLRTLVNKKVVVEEVVSWQRQPLYKGILLDGYIDDFEESGKIWLYRPGSNTPSRQPPEKVFEKIAIVVEKFGGHRPYELEELVNHMLSLTPREKIENLNLTIDEYLERKNEI